MFAARNNTLQTLFCFNKLCKIYALLIFYVDSIMSFQKREVKTHLSYQEYLLVFSFTKTKQTIPPKKPNQTTTNKNSNNNHITTHTPPKKTQKTKTKMKKKNQQQKSQPLHLFKLSQHAINLLNFTLVQIHLVFPLKYLQPISNYLLKPKRHSVRSPKYPQ